QDEKEEEVATKPQLQMQDEKEEEVATKPQLQMQDEKEEEVATKPQLQMQDEQEEEVVTKPQLQMQGPEEEGRQPQEEEEVATKPESQSQSAGKSLTSQLQRAKGKGDPLPKATLIEMGKALGQDFSNVRIHTDQMAVDMNQQLKSQAFTHGKDIYFNQGKFDPESKVGKQLLAHELTHVVQQNKK
ncbi:MAG: DUF4157 domain-containing protein, partial [Calothrix sp. MO_167.B12]|nr:DUF4157 domain-containing protein [Calothrix sp. MO_167.B12]